jgi:2-methylcitrate dehydratase PrpD
MHSAFGLALMQCAGGRQPVLEGRPAKAIYAAFCNQGGALSALLAAQGLNADCDVFLGEAGYFKTYYGGRYDRAGLVERLGKEFYLLNVGFKPWPTTGVAHPFIIAALEIRGQIGAASIEKVHLIGGEHARTFCEPMATRARPATPVEAEDSVPFSVAKALANGRLGLADLQPGPGGLGQPEAARIAGLISYSIDPALGAAGVVEVTAGGCQYRTRVDKAPPMGYEALVEKFIDCAGLAAVPVEAEAVVRLVEGLEDVRDVEQITGLLGGR